MQLYPLENFSSGTYKRLYYSPVSEFKPNFYKNNLIENSINFLSRDDVNKTLATKKMEPVYYCTADAPPLQHIRNISTLFVVTAVTLVFFGFFGTGGLNDPFNRKIAWCQRKYTLYDSILNNEVEVTLKAPCNKLEQFERPIKHSYAPMILGTATAVALALTIFIRLSIFLFKQCRTNY